MEFELAYYDIIVEYVSHNATVAPFLTFPMLHFNQ